MTFLYANCDLILNNYKCSNTLTHIYIHTSSIHIFLNLQCYLSYILLEIILTNDYEPACLSQLKHYSQINCFH